MNNKRYLLPNLKYSYNDLEPYISQELLKIHHQKHHQAYVDGANKILDNIEDSRNKEFNLDLKSTLKSLSFNVGGHVLHTLFWENLIPGNENIKLPEGKIAELIKFEFKSFDNFKKEFSQTALSVEGSGWATLVFDLELEKLMIMQIEKHNNNIYPKAIILMVLDVFEHAYYLDYKNDRSKFIDNFWHIINWEVVNIRLKNLT